jgi:ubiquinone/menaquinone biosynthesis C-methylase UbiE
MAELSSKEGTTQPNRAELLNIVFEGWAKSATVRRVWHDVYGEDYSEEVDPISFVTLTDLRRIAQELQVGPGQTFVDLACGRGGPGLWVARDRGATLVGLDFSRVAVEQATQRIGLFGLAGRARFQVGDFTATGLPTTAFHGAMSVDALWSVSDKVAAVREVARLLRSGARFVFTTWDVEVAPAAWPPQLNDHRPVLREAGFTVETYEETPEWEPRQRAVYEGLRGAQAQVMAEMGEVAAGPLLAEANLLPGLADGTDYLAHMRRILVVARKG